MNIHKSELLHMLWEGNDFGDLYKKIREGVCERVAVRTEKKRILFYK